MGLIQVVDNDKSQSVIRNNNSIGATVIKASRGGDKPVLFYPRSSKRIIDYFGIPDVGSEGVDDVLNYNNDFPIWVSAPSIDGRHGGVLVTDSGTVPFISGTEETEIDFSNIDNVEQVGIADGLITEFIKIITDYQFYNSGSIDILVDGVSVALQVSEAEPEILTTEPDIGSGTFTVTTGALTFTFNEAPTEGSVISTSYKTDRSYETYFALFNKNPQVDDLRVKITKNDEDNFVLDLQKKKVLSTSFGAIAGFPKVGSVVPNKQNGFGQIIYLENVFQDSDYVNVVVNTAKELGTFTDDAGYIEFSGGVRGDCGTAQLATGWDYFKQASKFKADIFFDTTADSSVPAIFDTLRNSYQKYSYYVAPTTNNTSAQVITDYSGIMTDNKGVAFYCGYGKIRNTYTGALNASSLMGRVALRHAHMHDVFNGLAPAFYNEDGRHGGQLGAGIVEMFYDYNEDEQQELENARINPIVFHPNFGVVITRERTSQSMQSDYSSIAHTRLRDYLIKNIIEQALPYQLYKLNDNGHRARVTSQIDKIIAPTAAEPYNLLREYAIKCDEENNNDDVMAREEFIVSVAIKFTKFSKKIFLFFTNTAQGVSVDEEV